MVARPRARPQQAVAKYLAGKPGDFEAFDKSQGAAGSRMKFFADGRVHLLFPKINKNSNVTRTVTSWFDLVGKPSVAGCCFLLPAHCYAGQL